MSGTDDVLAAISAAIDDHGVSPDAMRSGPDVQPDPTLEPLLVGVLAGTVTPGWSAPGGYGELDHPNGPTVRVRAIAARILDDLGSCE